jgi:hypothetical protein
LGTTLRAIGRGFGNGTLDFVSAASADSPMASTRLMAKGVDKTIDKAVDRNAAARADGITAFLRGGESFNR